MDNYNNNDNQHHQHYHAESKAYHYRAQHHCDQQYERQQHHNNEQYFDYQPPSSPSSLSCGSYHHCYQPHHQQHLNNQQISPVQSKPALIDPPSWASPARGESSLEPVSDTAITHPPVDLTTRRWYRIGRSPSSDVPLLHTTSSRRHALIFHHPSGPCYIVDCHSAHGTYIDGVRLLPNSPKRVRRGALLRFGSDGAPSFVLKSFSVKLEEMVQDLGGVAEAFYPQLKQKQQPQNNIICESSSYDEEDDAVTVVPPSIPHTPLPLSKSIVYAKRRRVNDGVLACIRGDGGGVACIAEGTDAPEAALVLLNTRLNALGKGGMECEGNRKVADSARTKFTRLSGCKRKRELDTLDCCKVLCKSNKKSILKKVISTKFNDVNYISTSSDTTNPVMVIPDNSNTTNAIITPASNIQYKKDRSTRRIFFNDERPSFCYAPSITLPELSSDEEDDNTSGGNKKQSRR